LFSCFDVLYSIFARLGCESSTVDVVFVLDSSGSIRDNNPQDNSYDNWNLLLQFVANVIGSLNIGESSTRVGIVKYSFTVENVFYLNSYYDKTTLRNVVLAIPYMGSDTNTQEGIRQMHYTQFLAQNGDRAGVRNFAIIITDGVSTINPERTIPEAVSARADGIRILSVGITDKIDEEELREMSSAPQLEGQTYWRSPDFQQLGDIVDALVTETCAPATAAPGKME
jgi:hypothetical protein